MRRYDIPELGYSPSVYPWTPIQVSLGGSRAYNLATEKSDYDLSLIVFPRFQDLYTSTRIHEVCDDTGPDPKTNYTFHDVRDLPRLCLSKTSVNMLQLLWGKVLIPMEWERIWALWTGGIIPLRDRIAAGNLHQLFDSCIGMAYQQLKRSGFPEIFTPDGAKARTHALRILCFLETFEDNGFEDFDECIRHPENDTVGHILLGTRRNEMTQKEFADVHESILAAAMSLKPAYSVPMDQELFEEFQGVVYAMVESYFKHHVFGSL